MQSVVQAQPAGQPGRDKPAFHGGHFALMGISALVLLVLAVVQVPFSWHAKDFIKKYSGNSLYANANPSQLPSTAYTQYALDKQQGASGVNANGTAVLGASTYDTSVPAKFSSLPILTSPDNSTAAIQV